MEGVVEGWSAADVVRRVALAPGDRPVGFDEFGSSIDEPPDPARLTAPRVPLGARVSRVDGLAAR